MVHSKRFTHAINSLYQGFYNQDLHPEDACKCAVGTICNGWDAWKHFSDAHGSLRLNYTGRINQEFGKRFYGYSPKELLFIEAEFLKGCGYSLPINHKENRPTNPQDPEILFEGMCAAIAALCSLEGVSNVIDYPLDLQTHRFQKDLINQ